jgi:hypothetical protein
LRLVGVECGHKFIILKSILNRIQSIDSRKIN